MHNHTITTDLIIDLWEGRGAFRRAPSVERQREIADVLDAALTSTAAYRAYLLSLNGWLRDLHVKLPSDDHSESRAYLRTIDDAVLDSIVERPLSNRSDDELAKLDVNVVAVNPAAIESLRDEILDDTSNEWLDAFAEAGRQLLIADGIDPDGTEDTSDSGASSLDESVSIAEPMRRGFQSLKRGSPESSPDGECTTLPTMRLQVSDGRIRWTEGGPADANAIHLDVEVTLESNRKTLRLKTAGIGELSEGCKLTARWLSIKGQLRAEATAISGSDGVMLESNSAWINGHRIQLVFQSSNEPVCAFEIDDLKVEL